MTSPLCHGRRLHTPHSHPYTHAHTHSSNTRAKKQDSRNNSQTMVKVTNKTQPKAGAPKTVKTNAKPTTKVPILRVGDDVEIRRMSESAFEQLRQTPEFEKLIYSTEDPYVEGYNESRNTDLKKKHRVLKITKDVIEVQCFQKKSDVPKVISFLNLEEVGEDTSFLPRQVVYTGDMKGRQVWQEHCKESKEAVTEKLAEMHLRHWTELRDLIYPVVFKNRKMERYRENAFTKMYTITNEYMTLTAMKLVMLHRNLHEGIPYTQEGLTCKDWWEMFAKDDKELYNKLVDDLKQDDRKKEITW